MSTVIPEPSVGPLLREWRERRRLTQLQLALDAGISTRHAPAFPERSLEGPELQPVREALDQILTGHEPYPAVVVDRGWNLVAANSAMRALAEGLPIDPALLKPPVNILRLGFHPHGLAPMIVTLGRWRAHFCRRLERQIAVTGDAECSALLDEITGYPAPGGEPDGAVDSETREMLGPVRFRVPGGGELAFFGMFATFDTPFEVTTSELAMELLFPADQATAERLAEGVRAKEARAGGTE
jgi:transcriptional regulator with XRE-family HTH domain